MIENIFRFLQDFVPNCQRSRWYLISLVSFFLEYEDIIKELKIKPIKHLKDVLKEV